MYNGHHDAPAGCRNPELWRRAAEVLAAHETESRGLCECGRLAPCVVRVVARRAQIRAMRHHGRAVGRACVDPSSVLPRWPPPAPHGSPR